MPLFIVIHMYLINEMVEENGRAINMVEEKGRTINMVEGALYLRNGHS